MDNLCAIKKLNEGDIFMLTTPIDTVIRGVVIVQENGRKAYYFERFNANGAKTLSLAGLMKHLKYLRDLK